MQSKVLKSHYLLQVGRLLHCGQRRMLPSVAMSAAPGYKPGPFIIDTDCGLDDLATLAAVAATESPLLLVTTVNGLAPPGYGQLLARRLLQAAALSVPVVPGAEAPPKHVLRVKEEWEMEYVSRLDKVTSAMGLDAVTAAHAAQAAQEPQTGSAAAAADAILETARAAGGVTVLALGSLTNLAAASQRDPAGFLRSVRRVVFIADTGIAPSCALLLPCG